MLDISNLYCNIAIRQEGKGSNISLRITGGTQRERAGVRTSLASKRLTLTGGSSSSGRRLVYLANNSRNVTQKIVNSRIGGASIIAAVAGDVTIDKSSGNVHIGSAQGVQFGSGLTVHITIGSDIRVVEH